MDVWTEHEVKDHIWLTGDRWARRSTVPPHYLREYDAVLPMAMENPSGRDALGRMYGARFLDITDAIARSAPIVSRAMLANDAVLRRLAGEAQLRRAAPLRDAALFGRSR